MNALTLQQLRKTYANGVNALRGIDLEVAEGDFFALLGPNGAGKSTAIGIISHLVRKTAGRVCIFGYDLDQSPQLAKRYLGLVPQDFNFNPFEPVEEILINQAGFYGIPRRQAYQKSKKILKQLDLWHKHRQQARHLSGGMKRRLMVARALIHEPRLMILDEPTAGVDIEIRRSLWQFMQSINQQGITIILTTHYLEEAENLCRHIAIIHQGRIVENSSMSSLLNRLNREYFILTLAKTVDALPSGPFQIQKKDGINWEVALSRKHSLNELFQWLDQHGLKVISLKNKQNRLEQFFMEKLKPLPEQRPDQ